MTVLVGTGPVLRRDIRPCSEPVHRLEVPWTGAAYSAAPGLELCEMPPRGTDKTDKTRPEVVLSVLSVRV